VQPTLESELRATRSSLERIVSGEPDSETAASLHEVIRSLRRLERSASRFLPFLVAENAATRTLLADLAPLLTGDLAAQITAAVTPPDDQSPCDLDQVNETNAHLRDLLSRAIALLPDDAAGAAACERTREHLLTTARQRPW
jgi:hypothetical protein